MQSADFFSPISALKKLRPAHLLAHALGGAGLFLLLTPRYAWEHAPYLALLAALAALAPDMDSALGVPHRTATHSAAAVGLVAWLAYAFAPSPIARAIALGYASHVLLDALHGPGVALLWPLPDMALLTSVGLGTLVVIAGLMVAAGWKGDAPLYHLWRTPTPTPAPTPAGGWPPCVPPESAVRVQVVRVIDGDTFIARRPDGSTDSVRLLGVNAPEVPHPQFGKPKGEPGGEEATAWLAHALTSARAIYIAPERGRDKYGRLLAYVVADGRLLNAELLRAGWARLYMESGLACEHTLAEAAAAAQLGSIGIWAAPTPTPSPTPTPTPTVGYDYQAALLALAVDRVHLRMTAVAMTATAAPWRYNAAWYDYQIAALTLDESEAWLRYQAHLAQHPPTPTPTPTPWPTPPHGLHP